jgi:hypothetical protein
LSLLLLRNLRKTPSGNHAISVHKRRLSVSSVAKHAGRNAGNGSVFPAGDDIACGGPIVPPLRPAVIACGCHRLINRSSEEPHG